MTTSKRNIAVATIAVAVAVVLSTIWVWSDEASAPTPTAQLEAPLDGLDTWNDAEAEENVEVQLGGGPTWKNTEGETLMVGPTVDGFSLDWERRSRGDWTVAVATGRRDGVELEFRIWTASTFPAAIVDVDARIAPKALGEPLTATAHIPADGAELLTGSLDRRTNPNGADETDVLAARFDTTDPTLQLQTPGVAAASARTDDGDWALDWSIWSAPDAPEPCLEDLEESRTVSSRLVVGFGDHPTVGPLPAPAGVRSLSTPIFVDAPARTDDAWADGRARDAGDLVRRFRALAFGHSDADDPRYGNGGLLGAGMGAIFAVPPEWREAPEMKDLADSLEDTGIELVSAAGESADRTRLVEAGDCPSLVSALSGDRTESTVARGAPGDPEFRQSVGAPIPAVLKAGRLPTDRSEILSRFFDSGPAASDRTGTHRVAVAPVIATRNPLEDIAADAILKPDSGGHWTLHDELTRRLSRLELAEEAGPHRTTGLADLHEHRRLHRTALPYWAPDGVLEHPREEAEHLFVFGNTDEVDVDASAEDGWLGWEYDATNLPVYDDRPTPTAVEFVDP